MRRLVLLILLILPLGGFTSVERLFAPRFELEVFEPGGPFSRRGVPQLAAIFRRRP